METVEYIVKVTGNLQEWFNKKGERHRLDGPAFIKFNYREYWIEGKKYTRKEFLEITKQSA